MRAVDTLVKNNVGLGYLAMTKYRGLHAYERP